MTAGTVLPSNVVDALQHILISDYAQIASIALLVYDLVITVDEEVEFVWKQSWSWMTWTFLLCRYTPLADNGFIPLIQSFTLHPSSSTCKELFVARIVIQMFGTAFSLIILNARAFALWNANKVFLRIIFGFQILVSLGSVSLTAYVVRSVQYGPSPAPTVATGCFTTQGNRTVWISVLLNLLVEIVPLLMTLYTALRRSGYSNTGLLQIIFHDGLIYIVYLIVSTVIMIVFMNIFMDSLSTMAGGFQRTLTAALASRIVLHLRKIRASLCEIGSRIPAGSTLEWAVKEGEVCQITTEETEDPGSEDWGL